MLESRAPNHNRICLLLSNRARSSIKKQRADIAVPHGTKWWEPRNQLKCKVTKVATTPISTSKKVSAATVYSVNNFEIARIQSLLKFLPQSHTGDETSTMGVPEGEGDSIKSPQQDNLGEVNIDQLSQSEKATLTEVLKDYADVFAANPKTVAAYRGPSMKLELKDLNSALHVAPIRHYTPEQRKMIQIGVEKQCIRCGFGLKTVPSPFANYVRGWKS